MLSSDRQTLVTNHEDILKRWLEHFSVLLNRPATASADGIESISNPIVNSLSVLPTSEEVIKAEALFKMGKLLVKMVYQSRFSSKPPIFLINNFAYFF